MFRSIFILIFGILLSPKSTDDYGATQLDWTTDFQGQPDYSSPFVAMTVLSFTYAYDSRVSGNDLTLNFKFLADVNRSKSWVKRDRLKNARLSRQLLNHEQGHANINYLLMRETEQRLTQRKYSVRKFKKEIKDLAGKIGNEYDAMQRKYDEETVHGTKQEMQESWDTLIASRLKALH